MIKKEIVEYLGNCDPQNTQILTSDVLDWMNKFLSERKKKKYSCRLKQQVEKETLEFYF